VNTAGNIVKECRDLARLCLEEAMKNL